jgi:hypothetical protein
MSKSSSRWLCRAAAAAIVVTLALVNPFGVRFLRTLSALADSGANHRTGSNLFGTSGGNVNDISTLYCCSGTLGSLVQDAVGNQYILSNNHVLARSNAAAIGEAISQPGRVDNFCALPPQIADLSAYPNLSSNVDAAIAKIRPNTMDPTGSIMDIGVPSSIVRAASGALSVKKSGRTTGLTTGTIGSINTKVSVQYQPRCGMGKKFLVSYNGQIVIGPGSFSAGGDSGSLIVTNDSAAQPVALLYAGSSTTTIGNPIGEVLSKVSAVLGSTVSFAVGTTTTQISTQTAQLSSGQTPQSIQQANAAKERWADSFLNRPGVIGVGVGSSEDGSAAAVVVYVDNTAPGLPNLPDRADGAPVRVVLTDPFVSR